MFAVLLAATLSAAAVPQSLAAIDRVRTVSAARQLASRMGFARTQAVMRSSHVALRFEETASGIAFQTYIDGNGNGIRAADIAANIDRPLDSLMLLADQFPGVAIAVSGTAGSDPVRLGSTNILSFTPLGTSTTGSIYVRGRDRSQYVVRILGTTGRTRIQRFVEHLGTWVDSL